MNGSWWKAWCQTAKIGFLVPEMLVHHSADQRISCKVVDGTHCRCRPSVTRKGPSVPDNLREVSRLELLLAPKQAEKVFTPAQDGPASQRVNRAIKMSAQWTDVQQAVGSPADVSPGNAAYAVHRLGCLASFASKKRNAGRLLLHLYPAL